MILGVFVIDIGMHIYTFGRMYLNDYWNISDIIVIILSIIFVILDINLKPKSKLKGILKLRGLFRLLRVFLLVRKLNLVRVRREVRKKTDFSSNNDLRAPVEKIISILTNHRDMMLEEGADSSLVQEINYCLQMILSDKLYDADIDIDESKGNK